MKHPLGVRLIAIAIMIAIPLSVMAVRQLGNPPRGRIASIDQNKGPVFLPKVDSLPVDVVLLDIESESNDYSGGASISDDGRYSGFASVASNLVSGDDTADCSDQDGEARGCSDVFVRDRQTSTTERVSVSSSGTAGNGASYISGFSADGRYVVYSSYATNLVTGDTNDVADIFVRDRQTSTTERVSVP